MTVPPKRERRVCVEDCTLVTDHNCIFEAEFFKWSPYDGDEVVMRCQRARRAVRVRRTGGQ